ncbi:MAG: rod shape-determining protein MreD [Exilispira sp.]
MIYKRISFYIFIGSFLLFIQLSSVVNGLISIKNVMPDLILISIILLFQIADEFEILVYSFICGFIVDVFSGNLAGLNALSFSIIVGLLNRFKSILYIKSLPFYLLLTLISLFIKLFIYYLFGYIFKEIFILYSTTLVSYGIHILYTLILLPFLYILLSTPPVIDLLSKRMYEK